MYSLAEDRSDNDSITVTPVFFSQANWTLEYVVLDFSILVAPCSEFIYPKRILLPMKKDEGQVKRWLWHWHDLQPLQHNSPEHKK